MTGLSQVTPANSNAPHGAASTPSSEVLLALTSTLNLRGCYWNPINALSKAKAFGFLDAIAPAADACVAALEPVGRKALTDRLTLLGMTMLHGKCADEQAAWLHETARLLQDYPQAILFDAIDACVKEPGRVFAPTVGEIIAKLEQPLRDAEVEAAHLRELAMRLAEGVEIPDYEPPAAPTWEAGPEAPTEYCSPEDARAILAEVFSGRESPLGAALEGMAAALGNADKPKTRADYIREGKVPPTPRPHEPIRV